jgi:tRNA modification GTPase
VRRAEGSLAVSDLVLAVLDRSRPINDDDRRVLEVTASRRRAIVVNKIDLDAAWMNLPGDAGGDRVDVSVRSGEGLDALSRQIAAALSGVSVWKDEPLVTNVRHVTLLEAAHAALTRARQALADSGGTLSEEFVLADLQDAQERLQEITGRRTSDDLLRHIFARFCIGK